MAKLVIAPALKPTKDRVEALVWIFFQLTVDGDVTRIANFLGQVSGVENVFGLEISVGLHLFQAQIHFLRHLLVRENWLCALHHHLPSIGKKSRQALPPYLSLV